MENISTLSNSLLQEWKKTSPNLKKCGELLEKVKVFANFNYVLKL